MTSPSELDIRLQDKQSYGQLASYIEDLELCSDSTVPQWPWALLVLCHIYNDELEHARFACKRAPEQARASEEFQAVFHLLQQLWNRRERVLELISKSYTTILVTNAAQLAGLSEADMAAAAEAKGWILNPETRAIEVPSAAPTAQYQLQLDSLKHLTEQMVSLDA